MQLETKGWQISIIDLGRKRGEKRTWYIASTYKCKSKGASPGSPFHNTKLALLQTWILCYPGLSSSAVGSWVQVNLIQINLEICLHFLITGCLQRPSKSDAYIQKQLNTISTLATNLPQLLTLQANLKPTSLPKAWCALPSMLLQKNYFGMSSGDIS